MQLIKFVGTAEEFERVRALFEAHDEGGSVAAGSDAVPAPSSDADEGSSLPADVIRRVLDRIPIPLGQRQLYRELYQAGEEGMTKHELEQAMDRRPSDLAGVLGALGRRINKTLELEGMPGGGLTRLIKVTAADEGGWRYRMRPGLRQVLRERHYDWLR